MKTLKPLLIGIAAAAFTLNAYAEDTSTNSNADWKAKKQEIMQERKKAHKEWRQDKKDLRKKHKEEIKALRKEHHEEKAALKEKYKKEMQLHRQQKNATDSASSSE